MASNFENRGKNFYFDDKSLDKSKGRDYSKPPEGVFEKHKCEVVMGAKEVPIYFENWSRDEDGNWTSTAKCPNCSESFTHVERRSAEERE
jgi:hypothetical protein